MARRSLSTVASSSRVSAGYTCMGWTGTRFLMHYTLEQIPGGAPGLRLKTRRIRAMVERAKRDPRFRAKVARLLRGVPEKDHSGEIGELVEYARRGIRYLRDPYAKQGLELFIEPRRMLADIERGQASGDCDDHVLLASAMLETAGYPTRYRVGGFPPDHYRHIWLDVQHPKLGWQPVEMTKKDWPIGRDPSGKFALLETHEESPMAQRPPRRYAARPRSLFRRRARQGEVGLGDFWQAVPPSAANVHRQRGTYWGATPSDFYRAIAMPEHPQRMLPLVGLANGGDVEPVAAPRGRVVNADHNLRRDSLPASRYSPLPGPSFEYVAEGFALPPGVPDQVAVTDAGAGGAISMELWDRALPGGFEGSFIPTPSRAEFPAPPLDPFDCPADDGGGEMYPDFGFGYETTPWLSKEARVPATDAFGLGDGMQNDCMEIGYGTMHGGELGFLETIGKAVGQIATRYQEARKSGEAFTPATAISAAGQAFMPVPIPETPEPIPEPPPAPPPPPARPAAPAPATGFGANISPLMLAGAGLLALMMLRR